MLMQNQQKANNKKIKKSQLLLFGSLLVFLGFCVLTYEYFIKMKEDVFMEMSIAHMENTIVEVDDESTATDVPITDNLPTDNNENNNSAPVEAPIDYSKYYGILEVPKIGLKRGFYNLSSRYNDIKYSVTMVNGSAMPDVTNSNLILMAHSGSAAISYFEYLYNLGLGDTAYITFNGQKYNYQLVNVYDVPKTGKVKIIRNYDKTVLTLITCTRNSDSLQTVYIFELV